MTRLAGSAKIPGGDVVARTRHGELTVDEIADLLPGLAPLMDLFARRYWTMYYAAREGNWELAKYEHREGEKLLEAMATVRPKYAEDLRAFQRDRFAALGRAVEVRDFRAFEAEYRAGIDASDTYHEKWAKPYIRFRLPPMPPEFPDVRVAGHDPAPR